MELFAHGGIEHSTSSATNTVDVILTVLIVTAATLLVITGLTYAAQRLNLIPVLIEQDKTKEK